MPLLNSFFINLKDGAAVRVALPLRDTTREERLNAFYGKSEPPTFKLVFPPGSLPIERLDTGRPCMITVDFANQSLTISAQILAIQDDQTLELHAKKTVNHHQLRNFFRVDASTRVAASSTIPEEMAREGETWRLLGDTVDLSGSGLLCSFNEPLPKGQKVKIELTLPTQGTEVITAYGHVVRCNKIDESLYHVALHFDRINSESQDKIMAYCFELQRRYLRMRVQVVTQNE